MTRLILAVTLISAIGITGYLWLDTPEPASMALATNTIVRTNEQSASSSSQTTDEEVTTFAQQTQPTEPDIVPVSMRNSLSYIASDYAEKIQHPPYSMPIASPQSPYLHWNRHISTPVPILDGTEKAALKLSQYRYFYPKPIQASLVASLPVNQTVLEIIDVRTNQVIETKTVSGDTWQIEPDESWPMELRLKAILDFDSGHDVLTADFRLYQPIAQLAQINPVFGRDADMIIPLQLNVDKGGIYRFRANLFTQNDEPVAFLTTKKRLQEGDHTVELKAFKQTLLGFDKQWQLKNIVIERMSGSPGERAQFGISPKDTYSLGVFDIDQLSDTPYQMSEQERMQLEFLQHAAR